MPLKDLLSNLTQAGELLLSMSPVIDSKLLVFFAGIVLGFLETNGYASPQDHASNLNALQQLLGTVITLVTIISYFVHNAVIEKNKVKYGNSSNTPLESQSTASVMGSVKAFVFKKDPKELG